MNKSNYTTCKKNVSARASDMWFIVAALEATYAHPLRPCIWNWLLVVTCHMLFADTLLAHLFPAPAADAGPHAIWDQRSTFDRIFPPEQQPQKLPYVLRNVVGEGAHCEVYSVGPRVPRGTALRDPEDGTLWERLHSPSCVGDMEVVSKVFRKTRRLRLLVRWNLEQGRIIGVWGHDTKEEEDPDKRSYGLAEAATSTTHLWLSPFLAETLLNRIVTARLVYGGLSPHFMVCQSTGVNAAQRGSLLLERLDAPIADLLNDHDVERDLLGDYCTDANDIVCMHVQLLHALHVAHSVLELKHHDLHADNVFVRVLRDTDCWRGEPVMEYTHFCYHVTPELRLYVPNTGLWVRIGDLGMASLTLPDGRRMGRGDMDEFNDPDTKAWGVWTHTVEEGYDMMLYFGEPVYDNHTRFWGHLKLKRLQQRLRRAIFGSKGRVSRSRGRPLKGHVTSVTPGEVLQRVFGAPDEAWYDFRTPPADPEARVLDMGDTFLVHAGASRAARLERERRWHAVRTGVGGGGSKKQRRQNKKKRRRR